MLHDDQIITDRFARGIIRRKVRQLVGRAGFTDQDAEALAQLLEARAIPFGGMSLEQLDGFLCGIVVSPEPIPQSQWMPRVWGKEPRWENERDREVHYAPILHLKAAIERRVRLDGEAFTEQDMPFIWVPEDGGPPDDGIPVGLSCRLLGFSRQAFYKWLRK